MINMCTQILYSFRYTMVHGQCLTVGVGGYLLKGGFNYLGGSARHGNGGRHVVRYTMVSPKGEIMVVDKDGVTKFEKGTEVGTIRVEGAKDTFVAEEKFIGKFTNYHHGIAGEVYAADEQTLK